MDTLPIVSFILWSTGVSILTLFGLIVLDIRAERSESARSVEVSNGNATPIRAAQPAPRGRPAQSLPATTLKAA